MAQVQIQPRSAFSKGAEGDAQFNSPSNMRDDTTQSGDDTPNEMSKVRGHNPPKRDSLHARLMEVSDEIVKELTNTETGEVTDITFRNICLETAEGDTLTRAVNKSYFDKVARRFTIGTAFNFTFESSKAGVTTYLSQGKPMKHKRSNDRLVSFERISENTFAGFAGKNMRVELITSKDPAYASAIAAILAVEAQEETKLRLAAK